MPPPYFLLRDSMKKRTGHKYPVAPKDEDLIAPIYGQPLRWRQSRIAFQMEYCVYFSYFSPFGVEYDLESGDFEIVCYFGSGKPSVWQLLWLRFRIWRTCRKIRKALQLK